MLYVYFKMKMETVLSICLASPAEERLGSMLNPSLILVITCISHLSTW